MANVLLFQAEQCEPLLYLRFFFLYYGSRKADLDFTSENKAITKELFNSSIKRFGTGSLVQRGLRKAYISEVQKRT